MDQQELKEVGAMIKLRQQLDPDAPGAIVFKHDHEDETDFKDGYHAGRENLESLEAQLAQAEDAYYQMQTELSSQLVSTQKALKGLYNAVQRSRSVNDPLGKAEAMEEAGKWF